MCRWTVGVNGEPPNIAFEHRDPSFHQIDACPYWD
jgi:hypothetical protein